MKTIFPPAGVGDENPPVVCMPAEVPNLSQGLGADAAGGAYAHLQTALDEAFSRMETTWAAWRESRPNDAALAAYLNSLSECNTIHQLLKNFPQYEPFRKNFPTSPSIDGVGTGASHGLAGGGSLGGEGMVERTVRGGGGALQCPRRLPLLGAAVPRCLAFGEPGPAGTVLRNREVVRPPMRPEVRSLWVALATVLVMHGLAILIHFLQ